MPTPAELLNEVIRRQGELEVRTDERHTENLAVQAQMGDNLHVMGERFTEHIRADEKAIDHLTRSLSENTRITSDNGKVMASVYSVVQKIEAAKTLSGWIRSGLGWIAAVSLSVTIIIAVALWALGRGPFPAIHP